MSPRCYRTQRYTIKKNNIKRTLYFFVFWSIFAPMKILYTIVGTTSLILGIIGIFLPLLPTTPFLLLTAAMYFRSSPRWYHWLIQQKYLGSYIRNNRVDWTLPYTVTEIETYAKPSAWHILVMGLAIPGIFLFLIGFCSLIRLLISISRREVFTSANVRRLRWFAYTSASLEILIAVDEWIVGNAAVEQISLPGYKIISYAGYSPDWVAVIIPILFAEIFAIGAKMKEEQDLTI